MNTLKTCTNCHKPIFIDKCPSCPEKVPKLKWQTGEPPEDELVICELDDEDGPFEHCIARNINQRMLLGDDDEWSGWVAKHVSRWVLYSDFLKVVE